MVWDGSGVGELSTPFLTTRRIKRKSAKLENSKVPSVDSSDRGLEHSIQQEQSAHSPPVPTERELRRIMKRTEAVRSTFSNHDGVRLEINNANIARKSPNNQQLNTTLLNNGSKRI